MRGGNFLNWAERASALVRQMNEADHARAARDRALELEEEMRNAKPSGALGDGRLGNLDDCKHAGMLNSQGLFLGAFGEFGHSCFTMARSRSLPIIVPVAARVLPSSKITSHIVVIAL